MAVAWSENDPTIERIWVNLYIHGWGWTGATQISNSNQTSGGPQVVIDAAGDAVVLWYEDIYTGYASVYASRYTVGWGWSLPTILENNPYQEAYDWRLAGNAAGDVVAVWKKVSSLNHGDVWTNRYVPGTGWTGATDIQAGDREPYNMEATVDARGDMLVTWSQTDGVRANIRYNRYVPGSGWGTDALAENLDGVGAFSPALSGDASGNATVVFEQVNSSGPTNVWANRYTVGSGWGTAEAVEFYDAEDARRPSVAVDGKGDAVAVFWRFVWGEPYISGVPYTPLGGWGNETLLETSYDGSLGNPQASMGGDGSAVAIWYQTYTGNPDAVFAARYDQALGWLPTSRVDTAYSTYAFNPSVALSSSGAGWAAWQQRYGANQTVWVSHFAVPDTTPPALVVTSPSGGSMFTLPTARVAGTTEPGATVSVDGYAAEVAADGSFALSIPLASGSNSIRVTATDAAGNMAAATVNVSYSDPVPGLQAQLASAQANVTALQASLAAAQASAAAAQASAASAQANVTAAQAALAAVQANANSTQAALDAARANLTGAQANLTRAQADLASAQAGVVSTNAQLNATNAQLADAQAQISLFAAQGNDTRLQLAVVAAQLAASQASLNDTKARLASDEARLNSSGSTTTAAVTGGADMTLPLLLGVGAMAIGAGGLVVGARAGSAVSRASRGAAKPDEARKPPT